MYRTLSFVLLALMVVLAACDTSVSPLERSPSEAMAQDERLSSFAEAMQSTSLDTATPGEDALTIFAPTPQAFVNYAEAQGVTLIELFASPDLKTVLANHIVKGLNRAADLSDAQELETLAGNTLTVGVSDAGVTLNGDVNVIAVDIEASNTVIHVIDAVLEPTQPDPSPEPDPEPLPSIVDIATSNENFSTLVAALQAADLVDTLAGPGPFSVFAPTNDAFAALLEELGVSAEELLVNPALKDILLYHVVEGKVLAEEIVTLDSVITVQGQSVSVEVRDGKVFLNDTVQITVTDIEASNGVVHVIDGVLLPASEEPAPEPKPEPLPTIVEIASADERFSTLVAALKAADLVGALSAEGPFTVFAPTNDAFGALLSELGISAEDLLASPDLKDILLYHVAAGKVLAEDIVSLDSVETLQGDSVNVKVVNGDVILNGSVKVIITDIMASNGVIHVLDAVLIPPTDEEDPKPSLVDIVVNDERFSILEAALIKTDLVGALSAEGPFTVFAPTNAAFEHLANRLGVETADLLELPNLADILLYHVSADRVSAEEAKELDNIETLRKSHIALSVDADGNLILNNHIKVIQADVHASNGVVHVIDGVLSPPPR